MPIYSSIMIHGPVGHQFKVPDGRVDPVGKTIVALNNPDSEGLWAQMSIPKDAGWNKPAPAAADNPVLPLNIQKSVGIKAWNRELDVRNVQKYLNLWIDSGRLKGLNHIEENGICGKDTKVAIVYFQELYVDIVNADGRIDPNGKTSKHLALITSPVSIPKLDPVVNIPYHPPSTTYDLKPIWERISPVWSGFGAKASAGHIKGQDVVVASMYNLDAIENKFILVAGTEKWQAGAGASAGAQFCVINGIYNPRDLNKVQFGGFDWSLSLGIKLSGLIKSAGTIKALAPAMSAAAKASRFSPIKDVDKLAWAFKNLGSIGSVLESQSTPSFTAIDIPFGGYGKEVAFYYGITSFQVTNVNLVDA